MDAQQAGEVVEGIRGLRRDVDSMTRAFEALNRLQVQMLQEMQNKTNKSDCIAHSETFKREYVTQSEFAPYRAGIKWAFGIAATAVVGVVKALFFGGAVLR